MTKKTEEQSSEIRKHVETGNVVYGDRDTLRLLKKNGLTKVYLASNCDEGKRKDIEHYGKLVGTEVVIATYPNDELGIICKRQHAVSTLGVKKG